MKAINQNVSQESVNQKVSEVEFRDALKKYSILIRSLARKLSAGQPAGLDYDDLCSSGRMGLLDAMGKFDPNQKKQFASYVKYRVRGAMLDAIRSHDWMPRSVKDKNKAYRDAADELRNELGREPSPKEITESLGLEGKEADKAVANVKRFTLVSIEDVKNYSEGERRKIMHSISETNPLQCPFESCMKKDNKKKLMSILHKLSTNERVIISLYYFEDLSYKEIGQALNLTESRVSQLHTHAINRLHDEFGEELKLALA